MYIHTHIYTYIHTYTFIHIYIHTYVHTSAYIHVYLHTYMYMHTYMHTCIHLYLSLILFILYINDLLECLVASNIPMFFYKQKMLNYLNQPVVILIVFCFSRTCQGYLPGKTPSKDFV